MDKYNLERFIKRQQEDYNLAYMEISRGRKESHWMWWIFPQIDGLGMSSTSRKYAIGSLEEAEAFLNHPYLGANLRNICEVLLGLPGKDPGKIFGSPDDLKLRSSMTLFAEAASGDDLFQRVLDKFYGGKKDELTLQLLKVRVRKRINR